MDKDYKALWEALYLWLNDYAFTYAPESDKDGAIVYQTARDIMNEMEKLENGSNNNV